MTVHTVWRTLWLIDAPVLKSRTFQSYSSSAAYEIAFLEFHSNGKEYRWGMEALNWPEKGPVVFVFSWFHSPSRLWHRRERLRGDTHLVHTLLQHVSGTCFMRRKLAGARPCGCCLFAPSWAKFCLMKCTFCSAFVLLTGLSASVWLETGDVPCLTEVTATWKKSVFLSSAVVWTCCPVTLSGIVTTEWCAPSAFDCSVASSSCWCRQFKHGSSHALRKQRWAGYSGTTTGLEVQKHW